MKDFYRAPLSQLSVFLAAGFSSQVAVALANARFDERVNHIAPIFGVAIAILLVGGYRFVPSLFLGALLPLTLARGDVYTILSVPVGAVVAALFARRVLSALKVERTMERLRDAFLILLWCGGVASFLGAILQSVFLCSGPNGLPWPQFSNLVLSNWLSASIGVIIVLPFVLTWANPAGARLGTRQLFEVLIWFSALILFGHVTFINWAPTDTLFYPMELAIFPIMAWSAFRFGLRGASAGVLALALLAAWELVPIVGEGTRQITESPANVWIFVGIVSVTSICLAAVMTEYKRREAEISENERRLRAFTDALPDVAFVLQADGRIVDVFAANEKICANHRIFNPESVRNKMIADLFEPSVGARFLETIQNALEKERVQTLEYSLKSADVGEHWFEARVTRMARQEAISDRVVWVAYNVSARKSFEAAIQHRDRILKGTARANNHLLTADDLLEAVERSLREIGAALSVDRAFIFQISGGTEADFHNFSIRHEWVRADSIPRFSENPSFADAPFEQYCPEWYETLVEKGIVKIDYNCPSERAFEVLQVFSSRAMLVMPMWVKGNLYGFFGVDYCETKHVWVEAEVNAVRLTASGLSGLFTVESHQADLRAAHDSANAASIAKGEFLAMMSHEIRTPMNAIIGYTDLLSQSDLNDQQSEHASIIKRSGRALLDLINNVLDYSKIESRSLELEAKKFDLEQVVCEALEAVLPMAKSKQLNVDYDISDKVREFYLGDPHRLRQVLLNLANNAIKFTGEGWVKVKISLQSAGMDSDVLIFKVIDTGIGISKEKLKKLFEPFVQVDSSTTRKFGGSGLGLAISKRLVERMGGEIQVDSVEGEGSNFQLRIALKHAGTQPEVATLDEEIDADALEPHFAKEYPLRILLCEDDKDNRWVIRELLEMLGYRLDVVESSEEALIQMQHRRYDAVLLDVRLPGRSGIELTRSIRSGEERVENQSQYIIAVTAYAMNEDREKCLEAGMNDYIRKPVEIHELKGALRRASESSVL